MTIKIKPGMYITMETLEKLGPVRYQLFRTFVRSRGYKVSDAYGEYRFTSDSVNAAIRLHTDGDLIWSSVDYMGSNKYEVTYEQVKLLIECLPEAQVKMVTNCLSPETNKSNLTIEELAHRIQRLTDQRDELSAEIDQYKQLLIKKLA